MTYRIGFLMDQIAGHITNYRNLRRVAEASDSLQFTPTWNEIQYHVEGGAIERVRERLPFVSSYVSGVLRGAWEMRKALRAGSYDALLSNASINVFFAREFRQTPTLVDFDSTPLQLDRMVTYTPRPDPQALAALKWRLTRNMLRSAWLLQAWSRWAKQSVVEDYGIPEAKVVVNPPGVDLNTWKPTARPDGAPDETQRVLFVGGDFRRKGGHLLLDWFRTRRTDGLSLHIVTREEVPQIPGVFVYKNLTPNSPELVHLYATADAFVLPSLGECFGIATVEAMAAGLPVVASDVGGTADIVEPGRNGFIVRANDVSDLGQAIEAILSDRQRRADMAAQSRVLAEERFDVVRNANRTFGYLKELASGERQRVA